MGQETGRGTSGRYEGIFQTHFWQNSRARSRIFQKQHLRAVFIYFNTCCHMHVECMVIFRRELTAWLGFRGGGGLRGPDTGDRMHLDGI